MAATYRIIQEACVACHACVRVCPTDAVVVSGDEVTIDEALCIGCGLCDPACNHDAIAVKGERSAAEAVLEAEHPVLILGSEADVFFYPATFEQVVNGCRALGFRQVFPAAVGDELVAREYLRLWSSLDGGTVVRSTCPITVDYIRLKFPDLLSALAPVATPAAAAARYLREAYRPREIRIVYAGPGGTGTPNGDASLDAVITFQDLSRMMSDRGVELHRQPRALSALPPERRRHLSVPGGMPLSMLAGERLNTMRVRKVRGLAEVAAVARSVAEGEELGFVDLTAWDGNLAHPSMGPVEELFFRRRIAALRSLPRSPRPVLDDRVQVSLSVRHAPPDAGGAPDAELVGQILDEIGTGPDGRAWDCGACGFETCRAFAEAAALGRASLRMCPPAQVRRAETLARDAAYDALTGLYTYRVFQERLAAELARLRRTRATLSLMMVDLDGFKAINDRLGHQTGNVVLRSVGSVIAESVRKSDLAARFGGDEFVVLLPETSEEGARVVADKILSGLRQLEIPKAREAGLRVGGSFGIAVATGDPDENVSPVAIFESADHALYEAKRKGGNTVVSIAVT